MKCYIKDYPRPQLVRKSWECLNGIWDFAFDENNQGEGMAWYADFPKQREIRVPFTYETKLSGIGDENHHNVIWYHRKWNVDTEKLKNNKFIIHFEGSDFMTKLWVNGQYAGCHRGGYARFSFDVSLLLKNGENDFTVRVEDSFDKGQPRGKQRWRKDSFGCWYVQTTGIWKTVWVEYVPQFSIKYVKMTPDMADFSVNTELDIDAPQAMLYGDLAAEITVEYEGTFISQVAAVVTQNLMRIKINISAPNLEGFEWGIMPWSPEKPSLYDITFRLIQNGEIIDEADSYFAMRDISIDGQNILLNGKPLYQRLILDQGYWKDSHLTPPDEEALIDDIEKIQALGYNGLRKHQKTEDERFLYWCDVKGMLVWSEAPAAYEFSDEAVTEFIMEWMEIVRQNYNHPCIITWTPFNESWGISRIKDNADEQHFTEAIYHITKTIDAMRPVIVNDGWEHTISDIITLHDYEEAGEILKERYLDYGEQILNGGVYHNLHNCAFAHGFKYKGQPVIISEFGGIAFDNDEQGWGYGKKVSNKEAFIRRFDAVTTAVKELAYVCGYCYTQVSDVQQEINGLLDEDRNFKVDPDIIREINERRVKCVRE